LTKRDRDKERERQAKQQTHKHLCYEWQMWGDWLRLFSTEKVKGRTKQ